MSAPTAGVLALKVQNVADRKVIGRGVISVLQYAPGEDHGGKRACARGLRAPCGTA